MEDFYKIHGRFMEDMEDLWRIYGGFMEDLRRIYDDLWRIYKHQDQLTHNPHILPPRAYSTLRTPG